VKKTQRWTLLLSLVAIVALAGLAGTAGALTWVPAPGASDDPTDPSTLGSAPGNTEGTETPPGQTPHNPMPGVHDNGRGGNTYVNDPCLEPGPSPDPTAGSRVGTMQSETELAVYGKYIVAGYNDSLGFYPGMDNQGLSGVAYSVNGGNTWIDASGLPARTTPGPTEHFGDPVIEVDKSARTFIVNGSPVSQAAGQFYYADIYVNDAGFQTQAVTRGRFMTAPPDPRRPESRSDTRCANNDSLRQEFNTKNLPEERIVWEAPVEAVPSTFLPCGTPAEGCDALDKEWIAVNQQNGHIYMTYTRFGFDGSTPIEFVKSVDGGRTWSPPSVIVPNLADTFNQATFPVVLPSGRIVVFWISRTFSLVSGFELSNRIEVAHSDDEGTTWSTARTVAVVNPQGEPLGYNRARRNILNAPYATVDKQTGAVYVTYFNGTTPLPALVPDPSDPTQLVPGPLARSGNILVSRSTDGGVTYAPPIKVNDDPGTTSHVFPVIQVNKHSDVYVGWLDRRRDPANVFTELWANVSKDGVTYGHDIVQTDIATTWFARTDGAPNFGDYNSAELLGDNQFVMTWADARFMPPFCTGTEPFCFTLPGGAGGVTRNRPATPDTIFTIAQGLGNGTDPNPNK
jgi:hypothetical protein